MEGVRTCGHCPNCPNWQEFRLVLCISSYKSKYPRNKGTPYTCSSAQDLTFFYNLVTQLKTRYRIQPLKIWSQRFTASSCALPSTIPTTSHSPFSYEYVNGLTPLKRSETRDLLPKAPEAGDQVFNTQTLEMKRESYSHHNIGYLKSNFNCVFCVL